MHTSKVVNCNHLPSQVNCKRITNMGHVSCVIWSKKKLFSDLKILELIYRRYVLLQGKNVSCNSLDTPESTRATVNKVHLKFWTRVFGETTKLDAA